MKKVRNWEFFVFMLVAILALSCSTQTVYAQDGYFKKGVKKGRNTSEPYCFKKDLVFHNKYGRIKDVAKEIGYEILDMTYKKKSAVSYEDVKVTFIEAGHRGDLAIEQALNTSIQFHEIPLNPHCLTISENP